MYNIFIIQDGIAKWYASLHAQMPFSLELTKAKEKGDGSVSQY